MQQLQKRVKALLSDLERSNLTHAFQIFLDRIGQQGANSAELKALLTVLQTAVERDEADVTLEKLLAQITPLLETVIPNWLTLAEAEHLYGVKADTLRRACWIGKLPGKKRGKTWFVKASDLERYL